MPPFDATLTGCFPDRLFDSVEYTGKYRFDGRGIVVFYRLYDLSMRFNPLFHSRLGNEARHGGPENITYHSTDFYDEIIFGHLEKFHMKVEVILDEIRKVFRTRLHVLMDIF